MKHRIYLSSPHIGALEQNFVADAFATNWIAPLGPHVDAFEKEFAAYVGSEHAVALSSGTAALHLALIEKGIGQDDEVLVSNFTFCASVNPILYQGATPVFIGSEATSWNMDANVLAEALKERAAQNKLPKAIVLVHLYGQSADLDAISALCSEYSIPLIEDAAEALGARYKNIHPGTVGEMGIFSFNGNKIITTSGGGMLVTNHGDQAQHIRKLATQARDHAPHYQHSEIGYNYRLSNVLAGIGRGQLSVLEDRVTARRTNFDFYVEHLKGVQGIDFMPEPSWSKHTRWLSCITIDPEKVGKDREQIRIALEQENIETRPLWKPMHLQPIYEKYPVYGGGVEMALFENGLCLPSGSNLNDEDRSRIIEALLKILHD